MASSSAATVEQYLEILDAHGVERGVIAAASPYGDYNDYTIAAVRNQPRLRGTAAPPAPAKARKTRESVAE